MSRRPKDRITFDESLQIIINKTSSRRTTLKKAPNAFCVTALLQF